MTKRLRLGLGLGLDDGPHQLLPSASLLETLEVTADRGTHVVQVAFLPHQEGVPARLRESSAFGARPGIR